MYIQQHLTEMRTLQEKLLCFIESDGKSEDKLDILNILENDDLEKQIEFSKILRLLIRISNGHYRTTNFFKHFENILRIMVNKIKTFSNSEIFDIFESNKRILLFLIKEKILIIDKYVISQMLKPQNIKKMYIQYFSPEIQYFIDNIQFDEQNDMKPLINKLNKYLIQKVPPNFFENRNIGENEWIVCEMIRNDSIENFVAYVNRYILSLESRIDTSIYETNSFLIKNKPSLIEYAAFFGSIQIFQYLKFNYVKLEPTLWLYAIHGKNAEIIHLLEENHIKPEDKSFFSCYIESVKCHHNEIAHYIKNNLLKINQNYVKEDEEEEEEEEDDDDGDENVESIDECAFKYLNYELLPDDLLNYPFAFFHLCRYEYTYLIEFFMKCKGIDPNFLFNIDDYEIISILGFGLFGKSILVKNKLTGKKYVIKESISYDNLNKKSIEDSLNFDCPSILKIKGYSPINFKHKKLPSILIDYYPNESLFSYLKNTEQTIDDTKKYILILGIAIAINFLHKHNFCLNELRPKNILIDENFYPVISDLELSNSAILKFYFSVDIHYNNNNNERKSFKAPEFFNAFKCSKKSNTFSFALIIYSIITGNHNFSREKENYPDISMIKNEYITDFLEKCWKKEPNERPNFDEIVNTITNKEFYSYFELLDLDTVQKYLDILNNEYSCLKNKFKY